MHPGLLTKRLAEGVRGRFGARRRSVRALVLRQLLFFVKSAPRRRRRRLGGVSLLDDRELPADAVVLALGPWMGHAARGWDFPRGVSLPEISAQRAHSVVLAPRRGEGGGGGGGGAAGKKGEAPPVVFATAVFAAVARRTGSLSRSSTLGATGQFTSAARATTRRSRPRRFPPRAAAEEEKEKILFFRSFFRPRAHGDAPGDGSGRLPRCPRPRELRARRPNKAATCPYPLQGERPPVISVFRTLTTSTSAAGTRAGAS